MEKDNIETAFLLLLNSDGCNVYDNDTFVVYEDYPAAAFTKKALESVDVFIETILKTFQFSGAEWIKNKKVLESRKEEIIEFIEKHTDKENIFTYNDFTFSLKEADIKLIEDNLQDESLLPYVRITNKSNLNKNTSDEKDCIPLIKENNWPGLSFTKFMPFKVKDARLYLIDKNGTNLGGPYVDAINIMGVCFIVEDESGKKYIIDKKGEKLFKDSIDDFSLTENVEYEHEIKNSYIKSIEAYCIFYKNDKQGFITMKGDTYEPEYDDIENISYEEDGRVYACVRKGGKYGYVNSEGKFEPENDKSV